MLLLISGVVARSCLARSKKKGNKIPYKKCFNQ